MHITAIYAAFAAILVAVLSVRVIVYRRAHRIGLGDGDDRELRKRIRTQANAIEYLPLALVLLLLLELGGAAACVLHGFGIALIGARVAHAWGVSHHSGISLGRTLGTGVTLLLLLAMAVLLLWRQIAI